MPWSVYVVSWANGGGCDASECAVDVGFERRWAVWGGETRVFALPLGGLERVIKLLEGEEVPLRVC